MYQLIIKNKAEENWEFNDTYESFEDLVERVTKTLSLHKKEIVKTGIYDLKPFEIKVYSLEKEVKND